MNAPHTFTSANIAALAADLERGTCRDCQHYARPGRWSSRCLLGAPAWAYDNDPTVRADNSCVRFESRADDELARASAYPGRG